MKGKIILFVTGLFLIVTVGLAGCTTQNDISAVPVSTPEPTPEPVSTPEAAQESISTPEATQEQAPTQPDKDSDHREYLALLNEAMELYDDYFETRFVTKSGYHVGRFWLPIEADSQGGIDMLRNQVRRYQLDNEVFGNQIRDLENRYHAAGISKRYPMSGALFLHGIDEYRKCHVSLQRAYEIYLENSGSRAAETVFFNADAHMNYGLEHFNRAHSLAMEGK